MCTKEMEIGDKPSQSTESNGEILCRPYPPLRQDKRRKCTQKAGNFKSDNSK